jgi:hypothetical protein
MGGIGMGRITRRDFLFKIAGTLTALEMGKAMKWLPGMVLPVDASPLPTVAASIGTDEDSAEGYPAFGIGCIGWN